MNPDERDLEDEEYLKNRDIILRNYQIKLFEEAQKQNTVLYLPTGSGKTLIAIHLLCSRGKEIRRGFREGGKRAFFVANTKVLVQQLCKVIKAHTTFKTAGYTGDMNVDSWNKNKWMTQFEENHVLVLTGEILRLILQLNFIKVTDISLLVIDECHHAVSDHPYRLIMQEFEKVDPSETPLVLGLSAVLLNSSPKKDQVLSYIEALEKTLKAKVITEKDLHYVLRFSANPIEKVIFYKDHTRTEELLNMFDTPISTFSRMMLKGTDCPAIPIEGIDFKDRNKAKRIKKTFVNCKYHFEELGLYGGFVSALYFIILLEKFRLLSNDPDEIHALIYARTEMNKIRHAVARITGEEETGDSILKFSSSKVEKLVRTIKQINEENKLKCPRILVFVHRRATAVVLSHVFQKLSAVDKRFSFIKPDFVIGSSFLDKTSLLVEHKPEVVVNRFATGSVNLLFATNLLEEGVDISACNVVISFDFPLGYPAYFQSRGRARDKSSYYYIFIKEGEAAQKMEILENFRTVERELHELQTNADESKLDKEDESSEGLEKIEIVGKSKTMSIDGLTAMKAVMRYCSKLPQDKFSLLSATSWYMEVPGKKKKAFVQLPVNCPLREVVEGEPRENSKLAKRSAFLATVKKLYEMGELDEDLNPRSYNVTEKDFLDLFPHYRNEEVEKHLPQPGTKKRKQTFKTKFAESLSNCLPHPGKKSYLHVIDFKVAFDKPQLDRRIAIYDVLQLPVTFALISSKKMRKILQFPLFLNLGRINCDLLVNYDEIVLNEDELNDIKTCHFSLFKKITRILKNFQVFDNRNKEHSFLVAPVEKNKEGRFVLNWEVIRCDFCRSSNSAVVRYNPSGNRGEISKQGMKRSSSWADQPTSKDTSLVPLDAINGRLLWGVDRNESSKNPKFEMTEADYKYFIVVPNYRREDPPQCYIVNKFCRDMSPLSPFPRPEYEDYCAYYSDKYMIDITNFNQPLLRVSPLHGCSNFNKPRDRKPLRARERVKEYEEHLVPELCDVIPFDKRFWVKAQLVPTVLNRIFHVYCVEEFRREIVEATGLGVLEPSGGAPWMPLEVTEGRAPEDEDSGTGVDVSGLKSALPVSKLKDKTQTNSGVPLLIPEAHLDEYGVCDLEFYIRRLREVEWSEIQEEESEIVKLISPASISTPVLNILQDVKDQSGPDLAMLIQASTSRSANDIVDYERLEILGDSFLKFATTLYLFRNYAENEGVLTSLKGKLVGNKNLLYCALAKNIQDVVNVTDFTPLSDWNPPLLRIPEKLVDGIVSQNVDPAVLYRFEIMSEEQFSGVLSETTLKNNEEILQSYEKCEMPSSPLLPYKVMCDKIVSDCVEAYIGSYLLTLGLPGAFDFLHWLGVLPKPLHEDLMKKPFEMLTFGPANESVVENILSEVFYSQLEDILNYRFKNKAILLEALTHPSFLKNRITDCYQRLELLGDAVLDFLITIYVYENCGSLTPGQVTDIRSSLVNNITFACLSVRYELYKYMLAFSCTLSNAVENFAQYQANRNHVIDENMLILLNESDCQIGEAVQVPKALGDIFESLAGGIFLDSGNSLETVWKVFYRLMKREIDEFTKTVPKSCVRLLHEICGDKPYFESKTVSGVTKVTCTVYYLNQEVEAHGFGSNKKEGKRCAAKLVLNKILKMKS